MEVGGKMKAKKARKTCADVWEGIHDASAYHIATLSVCNLSQQVERKSCFCFLSRTPISPINRIIISSHTRISS